MSVFSSVNPDDHQKCAGIEKNTPLVKQGWRGLLVVCVLLLNPDDKSKSAGIEKKTPQHRQYALFCSFGRHS